jgi:hypothetical protein
VAFFDEASRLTVATKKIMLPVASGRMAIAGSLTGPLPESRESGRLIAGSRKQASHRTTHRI